MTISGCTVGGSDAFGGNTSQASANIMTMDTLMSLNADGREAQAAIDESVTMLERLNDLFDAESTDSEITRINSQSGDRIIDRSVFSEDTYCVMQESIQIMDMTDGAYNPLVRPLWKLWGFTDNNLHVPDETEISNLMPMCSPKLLTDRGNGEIMLSDAAEIDFGAIAKGYASDKVVDILKSHDITGACMSLGGNIVCYGHKADGSDYNIAIDYPDDMAANVKIMGSVRLSNKIISTSSGAQRYLEDTERGIRYCHIIDSYTGQPAASGIKSVSIISDEGYLADGLSTACYVLGLDGSIELWRSHEDMFDMIIMTDDDSIYVTESIADRFTEYTDMKKPIIIEK